jgi:galactokinase/mevalonate kinase-like predicted kinase
MAAFDKIVITAANEAQAKGYRAQTAGDGRVVVVPDPGDKRVGSLGATVNAIRELGLDQGRILVCHSGGDARRTPGYAAMGKAFVPMRDGRSMFEHIVEHMEQLPLPEGMLVVSGDVLLTFDYGETDFSRPGVTGVAYPDNAWQARRHGVYVAKDGKVKDFLQKPQVKSGRHLIDTGIMFIDPATVAKMRDLPVAGDIYTEFPAMLLAGFAPFNVNVCRSCEFFHIGSSRELLERLGDGNIYLDKVHCPVELAGGNIVTNVPPGRFEKIVLGKNECLTVLPLENGEWYDLKYMLDDNFKTDGLWEKHGLGEKMKRVDHAKLLAVRKFGTARCCKVSAPVRIDFSGGWSDTPPICELEGGTVVNAAVLLNGKRPIEVTVKERKDRFVKIVSKDLGKRRIIKSADEINDHADPHDWCALVKSALAVVGFRFGDRGLDITISADLPKGSGMGTSSVLGAATIAALLGTAEPDLVSRLTLQLEQEMHTGGGWQDQLGGLIGGFKLLRSKPGRPQLVTVDRLEPDKTFLRNLKRRGLLYFTGQKRMARNILRKVLSFYAENPHNFGRILVASLKADAEKCAKAVREGDFAGFEAAVNGYWRDKKLLDPGSTNERVEEMIDAVRPLLSAVTLTGAGGGGFMFMVAKSEKAADGIRRIFTEKPPSKYSRFYDFELDSSGMSIEVV